MAASRVWLGPRGLEQQHAAAAAVVLARSHTTRVCERHERGSGDVV